MAKRADPLTLDVFRAANKAPGMACSLRKFFLTLSAADAKAVRAAIADRSIQVTAIHRVLTARGFTRSLEVIERHRHDACLECSRIGAK